MKMFLCQSQNRNFQILGLFMLLLSLIGCASPEGDSALKRASLDSQKASSEELLDSSSTTPTSTKDLEIQQEDLAISDSSESVENKKEPSRSFPQDAKLTAGDVDAQINLASEPSQQSKSKGYGLVGDTVSVLDVAQGNDGAQWYQVKFDDSGAEGWVEEKSVNLWNISESLINVSQLNSDQVKKMMTLDGGRIHGGEIGNGIFKVVLPEYIPDGFKLKELSFNDERKSESGGYTALVGYFLNYEDSNNVCFRLGAYVPPAGIPLAVETIEVYSPVLGKLLLNYTEFDEYSSQPKIELDSLTNSPSGYIYDFASPNAPSFSEANCNTMELEEAIKVVESLKYLNP